MTRVIDTTYESDIEVLQLGDYASQVDDVVHDARQEAQRIIDDAKAIARNIQREASERGYHEGFTRGKSHGYTDGKQQAKAELRTEFAKQSHQLSDLIQEIVARGSDAHDARLGQQSQQAVDFAIRLARKVVGHVAVRDVDAAVENMKKAMRLASCGSPLTIRVNPGQFQQLSEWMEDFSKTLADNQSVQMVPDASVGPGGVIVSSAGGQIDATIETQMQKITDALLGLAESDIES